MRLLLSYTLLFMGCSAKQLTRFEVPKQPIGGARDDAADDDAAPSSAFVKRIKPFDPNIAGFKPKSGSDTGILFRKTITSSSRRLTRDCPGGWVECDNGYVDYFGGKRCKEACDDECCVGDQACDYFTGEICKDNVTCVGTQACTYANIAVVVQGCNGTRACIGAKIDLVVQGCKGAYACYDAKIDLVVQGCNGTRACYYAGYNGFIGEVYNSCLGNGACHHAAYDGGNITALQDSCLGEKACYKAAYQGYIGDIVNACNAKEACYYVGRNGNISSGINNCCNEEFECRNITAEDDLPMACGTLAPTTAPTTAPTPNRTSKGSKSKASKKIPSGKGGKKNNVWKCEAVRNTVNFAPTAGTDGDGIIDTDDGEEW